MSEGARVANSTGWLNGCAQIFFLLPEGDGAVPSSVSIYTARTTTVASISLFASKDLHGAGAYDDVFLNVCCVG